MRDWDRVVGIVGIGAITFCAALIAFALWIAPALPYANSEIVFVRHNQRFEPPRNYIYRYDLRRGALMTVSEVAFVPSGPSIAPDGRTLVISGITTGSQLYMLDLFNVDFQLLEGVGESDLWPVWSPDGEQIAFTSLLEEGLPFAWNYTLYVMDADGRNVRQLIEVGAMYNMISAWSPDGEQIAFISAEDWARAIKIIDMNGVISHRLDLADGLTYQNIDWSPDGRYLVVSAHDPRPAFTNASLYTIEIETGEIRRLTDGPYVDTSPRWSPDGRHILFLSDRPLRRDRTLHIIRPDGRGLRAIMPDLQGVFYPAWRP